MSLQGRVALAIALLALLVVVSSGGLAYAWFVRQQNAELRRLLVEDVARVAALLETPVLGAAFADPSSPGFVVQLVDGAGRVVLAWGREAPLPAATTPTAFDLDGRRSLVAGAPWRAGGGSVRVAHDLEGALRTRADLARALAVGGALAFLATSLAAIGLVRRTLRPLEDVAASARAVDPETPAEIAYAGRMAEIRTLTDAINHTLAAIRARTQRERAFLLEVAHELAAPLTLVHYHLVDLRHERPQDAGVRAAAEAAQELLHTSQDLLVLARGELERPLAPELVDLRGVVARVADEYPGVGVDAPEAAEVIGDPDRLVQVVRNLVRNGVQATGAARGVRVALRAGAEAHTVVVEDDGPGIAPEDLERVFERGFRRGRGSGVGLTLARGLAERHGGSLTARSEPGRGAAFELRLPSLAARLERDAPSADA